MRTGLHWRNHLVTGLAISLWLARIWQPPKKIGSANTLLSHHGSIGDAPDPIFFCRLPAYPATDPRLPGDAEAGVKERERQSIRMRPNRLRLCYDGGSIFIPYPKAVAACLSLMPFA